MVCSAISDFYFIAMQFVWNVGFRIQWELYVCRCMKHEESNESGNRDSTIPLQ